MVLGGTKIEWFCAERVCYFLVCVGRNCKLNEWVYFPDTCVGVFVFSATFTTQQNLWFAAKLEQT